jgi:hypothetical protein
LRILPTQSQQVFLFLFVFSVAWACSGLELVPLGSIFCFFLSYSMAELLLCFKKHVVSGIPHDQRIPGCHAFARHFVKHIPGRRHVPALGVDVHQAGANLVAHACTWWPQVGGRHTQATEMMCGLGRNPQREHEKSVNARPGWGSTRSETRAASV